MVHGGEELAARISRELLSLIFMKYRIVELVPNYCNILGIRGLNVLSVIY